MVRLILEMILGWCIINLVILVLLLWTEKIVVMYRKKLGLPTAQDDGQARYIKLSEYRINRKRKIRTDSTYWLYYNIKGTTMENRVVDFNIDANGFIEPSGDINSSYRFMWGGDSTVEAAIVSPEKRFAHLVEEKFRNDNYDVASFNAGFSGGNIFEINILLLSKFLPLRPTHVFVCSNVHDIGTLSANENYIDPFILNNQVILDSDISKTLFQRIKAAIRTCVPNLYTLIYSKSVNKRRRTIKKVTVNEQIELKHVDPDKIEKRVERIRENYKYFITICKDNDVKPILMTQAGMFDIENEKLLNIYYKQFNGKTDLPYQEFRKIFHKVNDMIRDIAKEYNVVLIDLERLIPLDEKYIYDLVHYSEEGCHLVADVIYTYKDSILS